MGTQIHENRFDCGGIFSITGSLSRRWRYDGRCPPAEVMVLLNIYKQLIGKKKAALSEWGALPAVPPLTSIAQFWGSVVPSPTTLNLFKAKPASPLNGARNEPWSQPSSHAHGLQRLRRHHA
jgi:hypothetical protein